jgi:hypothetical protein
VPQTSSLLQASTIKDALDLIAKAQFYAGIVDVSLGSNGCSSVCAALTKRGDSSAAALMAWAPAISTRAESGTMVDILTRQISLAC